MAEHDDAPTIAREPIGNSPTISKLIPRFVRQDMYAPNGYAAVEVTTHELAFNRRYQTYHWIGKAWWPVRLSFYAVRDIGRLPWKLRKIEDNYLWGGGVYVREDGWLLPLAWLTDTRYRISRGLKWVYSRLILTAMVWGLAWVPEYEEPHWSHLGKKRR